MDLEGLRCHEEYTSTMIDETSSELKMKDVKFVFT